MADLQQAGDALVQGIGVSTGKLSALSYPVSVESSDRAGLPPA
jgi:hypothetical protein